MNKSIKNSLEIMEEWLGEVSQNNDHEIKQTNKLKTILFNLRIVAADRREIMPIADALSEIIKEMHDSTDILVTRGRKELREAFGEIKEYIRKSEVEQ